MPTDICTCGHTRMSHYKVFVDGSVRCKFCGCVDYKPALHEITPESKCACGHLADEHHKHTPDGPWVCDKCTCRRYVPAK
jgi:hypothetical protein